MKFMNLRLLEEADEYGEGGGGGDGQSAGAKLYGKHEEQVGARESGAGAGTGGEGGEGAGGAGTGGASAVTKPAAGAGGQGAGQGGAGAGGGEKKVVAESTLPKNFASEMATAFREAGIGVQPQQRGGEKAEISDEDFRKMTKYFSVTPETVTKLFGRPPVDSNATPEQQKEQANAWMLEKQSTMQGMLDGAAQHAIILAGLQTNHLTGQVRQMVEPLSRAEQQKNWNTFLTSMVDKKPGLKALPNGSGSKIVQTAIDALKAGGYRNSGRTQDEVDANAEKAIYDKIVELAQGFMPNFDLEKGAAAGAQGQQQRGGGRAAGMGSTVHGAGGSGAGNEGGEQDQRTPGQRLYAGAARK